MQFNCKHTMTSLFKCVSCHDQSVLTNDPRMLDCGHLICHQCVPQETINGIIKCPICFRETLQQPGNAANSDQGQLLKQLTDLLKRAELPCEICRQPAKSKCTQACSKVLCAPCMPKKTSKCRHKTIEPITMHCPQHPNFLIIEYCDVCSKLLCTRCSTVDRCGSKKLAINNTQRMQSKSKFSREILLAKREKLRDTERELSEIGKAVQQNTFEIIKMALITEKVVLEQLKQIKQSTCEQLESANQLLNQDFRPHSDQLQPNNPAITLLMEKLKLQILEASINTPNSKLAFVKGSLKPFKLTVYHDNNLYSHAANDHQPIESLDSWTVNNVYESLTHGEIHTSSIMNAVQFPKIMWIENDSYIEANKSGEGMEQLLKIVWPVQPKAKGPPVKPKPPKRPPGSPATPNGSPGMSNGSPGTPNGSAGAPNGSSWTQKGSTGAQKGLPWIPNGSPWTSNDSTGAQKSSPWTPNGFTGASNGSTFESKDMSLQLQDISQQLDPNFIRFAENAEDYEYADEMLATHTTIDWTYPPHELKNWTKETSRVLVIPDGQTILTYHTGSSSTQIYTFNDSGQQLTESKILPYQVLDMAYSPEHQSVILLEKKSVHYMDVNHMTEKWEINTPDGKNGSSLVSCAIFKKGILTVLYESRGKFRLCMAEVSSTGSIEKPFVSPIPTCLDNLQPFTKLQLKTDNKSNIYIINKKKGKIIIIKPNCRVPLVLHIPSSCSSAPGTPQTPNHGIFLTCNNKLGYVEHIDGNNYAFYWINSIKNVVHVAQNTDQIICVTHSDLYFYHKRRLF